MIYKILCLILLINLLLCYRRSNKERDPISIVKSCAEIFYYRDGDTEFFKLNIGGQVYNSLHDFLGIFKNGNELLEKIQSRENNFHTELISKNELHRLNTVIRHLDSNCVIVTFSDLSDLNDRIQELARENTGLKRLADLYNRAVDSVQAIIYAKKNDDLVCNRYYLENKDHIKIEQDSSTKEVRIPGKVLQVEQVLDNGYHVIHGFDITELRMASERVGLLEKNLEDLMDYSSDAIFIVDKKFNVVYRNKQYENFSSYFDEIKAKIGDEIHIAGILLKKVQLNEGLSLKLVLIPQQRNTIIIIR